MSKLRVGVVIDGDSIPTEGGGHSYYYRLLQGINDFDFHPDIEIVNVVFYNNVVPELKLKKSFVFIKTAYGNKLKGSVRDTAAKYANLYLNKATSLVNFFLYTFITQRNKKVEEALRENRIDLLYYLKPKYAILNYPFIATHWDIAHRSVYSFPEVSMSGEYEVREEYYSYTLNKAFLILCESEAGSRELKSFYSVFKEKIKILPAFGGKIITIQVPDNKQQEVLKKYSLEKSSYFIYPAQFWAHKNHYNLIVAFRKLLQENPGSKVKLVLCGSDKGNGTYIKELVESFSLQSDVLLPGFVHDDELYVLYKNALALTMATFLGPTNLPLIEAAHLQCPVLCSDLEGHREILGEHSLYFQPADSESIKQALVKVLDRETREKLSSGAYEHIRQSAFNLDKTLAKLNEILVDAIPVRKTWGLDYASKH